MSHLHLRQVQVLRATEGSEAIFSHHEIASSQRTLLAMTSSRDGGDQHDLIAFLDRCIHALQVFDVVLANKQIHKWAQFTRLMEQMRLDGWELGREISQCFSNL